jgi:hypothetical protein
MGASAAGHPAISLDELTSKVRRHPASQSYRLLLP